MDIDNIRESLNRRSASELPIYERRVGKHHLIIPVFHEDGDMIDIYFQESPRGDGHVRICDFGMTLMRLSCTFDATTDVRQRILDSIFVNNNVSNDHGNLHLDTPIDMLYESVLQFAGCVQKVCNMRYWSRETVRSAFYDDLSEYITAEMSQFSPVPDTIPLEGQPVFSVDWFLSCNNHNFYVFGVRGNDKAKNVAITLLEFQKVQIPFISLVVHEDMEELGRRERLYLTRNADTQYPILSDFRERSLEDIKRFAA